jgi:uncharacterized protein YrrD
MTVLMRASEIIKRPVVTMAGEDVAQIKDIVYAAGGGEVGGFTLNGRGLLSSPLKTSLPWAAISALGPDAVMIDDEAVLVDHGQLINELGDDGGAVGGDVLGARVLTEDGTDLGKVIDVIIEVAGIRARHADVVGYEIEPSEALGQDVKKVLMPLPDTIAASGEHLMVPASARDFVSNDLAGFGAAVAQFRAQLEGKP